MGLREYARHRAELGLSGTTHQAVREAIRSCRLVRAIAGGKINAAIADEEWKGATLEDRVPITGPAARRPRDDDGLPDGIPALHESRARREAAEAALAEIELAEKRGELVLAGDVEARLVNVFSSCKKKLLAVPSQVRQRDPSMTPEQVDLVESVIREALEDLARG